MSTVCMKRENQNDFWCKHVHRWNSWMIRLTFWEWENLSINLQMLPHPKEKYRCVCVCVRKSAFTWLCDKGFIFKLTLSVFVCFFQTPQTPCGFGSSLSQVLECQERELESRRSSMITMEVLLQELNAERTAKNQEIDRLKVMLTHTNTSRSHFSYRVNLTDYYIINMFACASVGPAQWKRDCANGDSNAVG